MQNDKMRTKQILESLCPAIGQIDRGCYKCINSFIETANEAIKDAGFEFVNKGERRGETEDGMYYRYMNIKVEEIK